ATCLRDLRRPCTTDHCRRGSLLRSPLAGTGTAIPVRPRSPLRLRRCFLVPTLGSGHNGPLPGGRGDPCCCGAQVRLCAAALSPAAAAAAGCLPPPSGVPLRGAIASAVAASRASVG
ncbi:unnamed protein product, partial [Symbiodinium natans]